MEPRFGLGPIDQISFAVADVDEAVGRYTAMFGGPFLVIDVPEINVLCRGVPSTAALKLGFGRTGSLEVELVQVVSGEWPTSTWLADHGEGLHHVRYPVADVAATRAAMAEAGFEVTLESVEGPVNFAYLESPLLNGMTIELVSGL